MHEDRLVRDRSLEQQLGIPRIALRIFGGLEANGRQEFRRRHELCVHTIERPVNPSDEDSLREAHDFEDEPVLIIMNFASSRHRRGTWASISFGLTITGT